MSKHRANWIFHKFTFSSWLQQILILGDSSQYEYVDFRMVCFVFEATHA